MQGAKAYILPGVAALLLVAYFLFRPDPSDLQPSSEQPTPDAPTPTTDKRGKILAAVTEDAAELGEAYVRAQLQTVTEVVRKCSEGHPVSLRLTLAADPELGGVVERVAAADGRLDPGVVPCVQQAVATMEFPPPPAAGRSTIVHSFEPQDTPAP